MKVLDTIEVTVEHGGEELTLDVEITQWATKGGHEDPPEGAEWRVNNPGAFRAHMRCYPLSYYYVMDAINDQVQEHCAERAAPGREG